MSDREDKRAREDKLDAAELNSERISEKIKENETEAEAAVHSKLSDFWYYNKWKILVGIGVLIVLIICIAQCSSNNGDDATLLYAGSYYPDKAAMTSINSILSTYLPSDYNGDGTKSAYLTTIGIYSDEQVEEAKKKAETDSSLSAVNVSQNQENYSQFHSTVLTGEYSICILEPWLYKEISKAGGFRLLSDVLGSKPENAYSDYAVLLSETAVYKENPGLFDGMTADTLICFRTESQIGKLTGKGGSSESYTFAEQYFRALVNGKAE